MSLPKHAPPTRAVALLDALWQAPVIVWVIAVGEGLAAILSMAPGIAVDRWTYFGLASLAIQWVLLLTLGGLYLLRRRVARWHPLATASLGLVLLILATWLIFVTAHSTLGDYWYLGRNDWLSIFLRFTGIALTTGLLGLAAFHSHWRKQQLAVRAKQAELEALQARIRPHFLFNTLNTGVALVHDKPEAAERLLLDLSDLFRAAISGTDAIPLAEELSLARRYLEIEQLRFGDRLRVHWDVPDDDTGLPALMLPPLSIQPLVENAVKHGIEACAAGGEVSLALLISGDTATVRVRNPVSHPDTASAGHGIGLDAVQARLKAFTQGRGWLQTTIHAGEFIAELSLPLSR